jgi:hypothetical protein
MISLVMATDAVRINEIINDPSIYPFVHGQSEGPLDLTLPLADDRNVALLGQWGGVILDQQQPGIYEAHVQALPRGRGAWTVEMARAALAWAFTHTEAVEILIRAPKGFDAAKALVEAIGAKFQFRAERGWIMDGEIIYADIYSLVIQDWMLAAREMTEIGASYRTGIDAEYERLSAPRAVRDVDEAGDRFVGCAVEMIRCGQPDKGAVFYNRWAAMANRSPIAIVNREPLMIDIGDCVLELHGSHFFIFSLASKTEH